MPRDFNVKLRSSREREDEPATILYVILLGAAFPDGIYRHTVIYCWRDNADARFSFFAAALQYIPPP